MASDIAKIQVVHSQEDFCVSEDFENNSVSHCASFIKPLGEINHNFDNKAKGNSKNNHISWHKKDYSQKNFAVKRQSVDANCNKSQETHVIKSKALQGPSDRLTKSGEVALKISMGNQLAQELKIKSHNNRKRASEDKCETIAILEHSSLSHKGGSQLIVEHQVQAPGNTNPTATNYGSVNGLLPGSQYAHSDSPYKDNKTTSFSWQERNNQHHNNNQSSSSSEHEVSTENEEEYSSDFDDNFSEDSDELPNYFYSTESESCDCVVDMDSSSNETSLSNSIVSKTEGGGSKEKLCNIPKPKFLKRVLNYIFSPTPSTPQNTPGTTPANTPQHSHHASTQEMHSRLELYANRYVFRY